jgi:hypothetical protein
VSWDARVTKNLSIYAYLPLCQRHNTIMESPEARARAAELHKLALEQEKLNNPSGEGDEEEQEEGENDGDVDEVDSEEESEGEGSNEEDDGEDER